jgi:hypothetical protein
MKSLLSLIYAARAAAVVLFLLGPKTEATVLIFRCGPRLHVPLDSAAHRRPRRQMFGTTRLALFSASSCCRTRPAGSWARGSAARCSQHRQLRRRLADRHRPRRRRRLVHLPIREAPLAPRAPALAT